LINQGQQANHEAPSAREKHYNCGPPKQICVVVENVLVARKQEQTSSNYHHPNQDEYQTPGPADFSHCALNSPQGKLGQRQTKLKGIGGQ
jgi:hypothetical protein